MKYVGVPEEAVMIMNRNVSTPFNVAQHVSEMLCSRSALALVNDQLWDMHRQRVFKKSVSRKIGCCLH